MKNTLLLIAYCLLLILLCHLLPVTSSYALSLTPTPTVASDKPRTNIDQQINDLKDRIASRVAQLKLVERRGIIGTVTDISDTQITLADIKGDIRFVDVDELTKFSSPALRDSFGISDITKGSKLGILGLYNKQSRRVLARFVDVLSTSKTIHGAVSRIDTENYAVDIMTDEGKEVHVDIENITKTLSYTKDAGMVKSGFSKIKVGEHLIVIGFIDTKNKNNMIATRIILFPDFPKDPKITIPDHALSPQETVVPSTGSGKKLTPITR